MRSTVLTVAPPPSLRVPATERDPVHVTVTRVAGVGLVTLVTPFAIMLARAVIAHRSSVAPDFYLQLVLCGSAALLGLAAATSGRGAALILRLYAATVGVGLLAVPICLAIQGPRLQEGLATVLGALLLVLLGSGLLLLPRSPILHSKPIPAATSKLLPYAESLPPTFFPKLGLLCLALSLLLRQSAPLVQLSRRLLSGRWITPISPFETAALITAVFVFLLVLANARRHSRRTLAFIALGAMFVLAIRSFAIASEINQLKPFAAQLTPAARHETLMSHAVSLLQPLAPSCAAAAMLTAFALTPACHRLALGNPKVSITP